MQQFKLIADGNDVKVGDVIRITRTFTVSEFTTTASGCMILNIYTDASTIGKNQDTSGIGVVVTFDNEIFKTIGQHLGNIKITDAELLPWW